MIVPPTFDSIGDLVSTLTDTSFWAPYVLEILQRHDLPDAEFRLVEGFNATHPTFVCGAVVVKLFGHYTLWRRSYVAEHAAHVVIAADREIRAPRLLAAGNLFDGDARWPYLVTSRMPGTAWSKADLTPAQKVSVVAELGRQIRRVHMLPQRDVVTEDHWRPGDVAEGNRRSSLPPHLVAQVDEFLGTLPAFDRVVVHGDVVANHAFVEGGRLCGIIDWGDTMWTDRHAELIQPYRDLFDCDKELLGVFLDASEWPVGKHFARQTLGLALLRQAVGLEQHHSMDVFEPVAARFPLDEIGTLDELAILLFAV